MDPEMLRLARAVCLPEEAAEAQHLAAFLPSTDAEALAIVVLTRLSVDGVTA